MIKTSNIEVVKFTLEVPDHAAYPLRVGLEREVQVVDNVVG